MRLQVLYSSVFLTILALSATGFAQDIIRCNSDDMRRHYCEVGPNREIRFARQVSESRCVPGSTFGIERNRIWVDRGCRADFQVYREDSRRGPGNSDWGRNHNPNWNRDRDNDWRRDTDGDRGRAWGGGSGRTVSMSCNSNDEGYHSCAAEGQILRARMTNQHSGSPCTEGRSWGFRGSTLWVDRGCRADFEVTLRDQGGFGGGGSHARGRTYNMRCNSDDFGYHTCSAEGEVVRARMIHQVSGSACTEGRTWGYRREGVWVDKGCRAEFEVTTR